VLPLGKVPSRLGGVISPASGAERFVMAFLNGLGRPFAYGSALPFSGTVPGGAIAHLAASLEW